MGELTMDNILNANEIEALFEGTDDILQDPPPETNGGNESEDNNKPEDPAEVSIGELFEAPESVGSEDEGSQGGESQKAEKQGSSPNNSFYSSIAKALIEDRVLSNLDDKDIQDVKDAEDFANLIKKHIEVELGESQKRINEALGVGVEPNEVKRHEDVLNYLDNISEDDLTSETPEGEDLRKRLIYQDFINRSYSKERAEREVLKSLNAGSDIEDAKEALLSNKEFFNNSYKSLIKAAKDRENEIKKAREKDAEDMKKSIMEDKNFFGELSLNEVQRKKVFENLSKPVYKDPDTGKYLTAIQKYDKENHFDFMKKLGILFTLTDGFKDLSGLVKTKVNKEVNKGLRNLEESLNSTARNSDGSLKFVTGLNNDSDPSYFGKGWKLDV